MQGEPTEPPDEQPTSDAPAAPTRPKWLAFVTVSAVVAGCLFGCCGMWSVGSLFAQRTMPFASMAAPRDGSRMADVQQRYMERLAEIQHEVFPLALASGLLGLGLAVALVVAGILAHRRNPLGRRLLVGVFSAGVVIELMTAYAGLTVAQRQNAAIKPMMMEMMDAGANANADQDEDAKTREKVGSVFAGVTSVFTWLTVLGFLFVKATYYILCARYLRRPDVIGYFEAAEVAPP